MGLLQRADVLKAIVSSCCLSNYRDLFNLRHLVRQWCTTTHTFFLSYDEIIVTLEDVANQLLLPIFGDANPGALELSPKEEAVEAELKKRMSGNVKLSFWASSPLRSPLLLVMRPLSRSSFVSLSLALIPTML